MKSGIALITCIILFASIARPQEIKSHSHRLIVNFLQIKDQMNYGLVFKGPGLGYSFSRSWENEKRIIGYEGRFAFNVLMAREILAPSINLVPVRFDYLFKTGGDGKFSVGPYAIIEYNYELYPDLQSGYSFWFTNYSLGGAIKYSFAAKENLFDLSFHTTLLGLTSRQPVYDDPYFFDLSAAYIAKFVHQDLQFGSWGNYINAELEMRWTPKASSRLAYGYSFGFYNYGHEPLITMINQSIKFIFLPKKSK
jgi:hypothetical protein